MKKVLLLSVLLHFTFLISYAQRPDFDPQMAAKRISTEMQEFLSLSDEQAAQVLQLNQERMSEMAANRGKQGEAKKTKEEAKLEREQRKQKMEAYDQKLKEIIGEKNFYTWEIERQRRMESRRNARPNE